METPEMLLTKSSRPLLSAAFWSVRHMLGFILKRFVDPSRIKTRLWLSPVKPRIHIDRLYLGVKWFYDYPAEFSLEMSKVKVYFVNSGHVIQIICNKRIDFKAWKYGEETIEAILSENDKQIFSAAFNSSEPNKTLDCNIALTGKASGYYFNGSYDFPEMNHVAVNCSK